MPDYKYLSRHETESDEQRKETTHEPYRPGRPHGNLITGGARGIGLAVAERALESGADVSLWDVDGERLQRTSAELAAKFRERTIREAVVELTDEASVAAAVNKALAAHGRIDVLVNNAGITGGNGTTWELAPDVWRRVIDVNLIGPYLMCRAVVPHMLKAGYGRIVNIASIAGKEGNPNASHYSASKAGLIGLTKSLGKELAGKNILVNAVTPAAAKTEIFDSISMSQQHIDYMLAKILMNRFLQPQEAASLILWLASEDCAFSTGAVFDLSGGRATY
ncbi:3-oxoacyl-[acyl-carrier protein] reductase [Candidatus Paraburkholderia schumanniana]|nr:3-oxoacyl-[acyl-carrier protein] reductase [Candidatus Paraburkholderia schumannianae]